ncbi:MAG: hypothetical protein ACT4PV_08940 [Planctomycetaceae bacterium]
MPRRSSALTESCRWGLLALAAGGLARADGPPPETVTIAVAATKGQIIPQSRGGGGFQRTFRFTATPGRSGHWIRQLLAVRGTVLDGEGNSTPVHLDVTEYYRVDASGRTIQADSHYSQFWKFRGGDLTISSTLTYGMLRSRKQGDTILGKSFILRAATDAAGEFVTMETRTTRQEIPAERGERVEFDPDADPIPTDYRYRVQWNARPGIGPRTQPSGTIEIGTWSIQAPKQTGPTREAVRPRPIPRLETRDR